MLERKIYIKAISENKVFDVIQKVNKLVEYYADKSKSKWLYETYFFVKIGDQAYTTIKLKRINMEREFYHLGFGEIFHNSPFKKNKTLYSAIYDFTKRYYPEYLTVEFFIKKLLYEFPNAVTKEDFEAMNALYKGIKKYDDIASAAERIWDVF